MTEIKMDPCGAARDTAAYMLARAADDRRRLSNTFFLRDEVMESARYAVGRARFWNELANWWRDLDANKECKKGLPR